MTTATLDKPQTATSAKTKPETPSGPTWTADAAAMTAMLRAVDSATTCTLDTYRDKVLLAVEDGRLTAYADNMVIGILARGPVVDAPFPPIVAAHGQLSALVGRLSGPVEFRVTDKGIEVTAPSTRATVRILGDVEQMPIPPDAVKPAFAMPADNLARAIGRAVHAAATDDSRPVLAGLHVDVRDGVLTLAAADGFVLAAVRAWSKLEVAGWPQTHVNLPANDCRTLAKLLASAPDGTRATFGFTAHGRVIVETPDWRVRLGVIDGSFPDYRLIAPSGFATVATANRAALTAAVKTAGLFAGRNQENRRFRLMKFAIGDDRIVVSGTDADLGSATAEVAASIEGPPLTLAIDASYLGEVLAIADGDDISLCANSANQAVGVRDAYEQDAFVIMPVILGTY